MNGLGLLVLLAVGKQISDNQIKKGEYAIAVTKKAKKEIKIFVSEIRTTGILGWYEGKWGYGFSSNKTRIKEFLYDEYDFIKIVE